VTRDRAVIAPTERRAAVLRVIRGARRRLGLTMFRCNDADVLAAVAAAVDRGVEVDVLLTRRASGWKRRLDRLEQTLRRMGAHVARHGARATKHHAKYIVADEGPLLVASFNLTRKCFHDTCDFAVVTHDPAAVTDAWRLFDADLARQGLPTTAGTHSRLVVGPEWAAVTVRALLTGARERIRIIDHKFDDPRVRWLLAAKVREGVRVEHLGQRVLDGRAAHGKLTLIDGRVALVGSLALSATSLSLRRELSLVVHDPAAVARFDEFFTRVAARGAAS
jgi:cardiolipin synthase A/B